MKNGTPGWRRWAGITVKVLAIGLVGFLVFRFVREISFGEILGAVGALEPIHWVLLVIASLARLAVEPLPHMAVLPGLSWWRGELSYLAPTAAVSVIPGPSDLVARYAMYRSWNISNAATALAVSLSWIYTTLAKALLPVISAVTLLIVGTRDLQAITVGSIAATAILAVALALVLLLRSERVARRLGHTAGHATLRVATRFRIEVPPTLAEDLAAKAAHFRETAGEIIRTRWLMGSTGAITAQLLLFTLLLISLRGVGLTPEQLSGAQIFAAFAFVQLITSIPVTPGGLGVAEASYVLLLTAETGAGLIDPVTAGVLIYRVFSWLLLIPLGGLAWGAWRATVGAGT